GLAGEAQLPGDRRIRLVGALRGLRRELEPRDGLRVAPELAEHEAGGAGDVGDEVGASLGGGELAQHVVEERDGLLTAIGVGERDRGEAAQLARRKARGAGIPQRLEREDRGIVRAARRDEPADAVLSEADEEQVRVVARQRLEARLGEREAARALLGRILLAAERDEAQRGGRA